MVIGVSSRALFDLTIENEIFERDGLTAYCRYQVEHEQDILKPGPGFGLIKSLLKLNAYRPGKRLVDVIIMSRNSPDSSLRVFNSIAHYGLDITRSVLVSGASLAPYLTAFRTDLFLSAYEDDVRSAIDSGIAAGIICTEHRALEALPQSGISPRPDMLPGPGIRPQFDAALQPGGLSQCRTLHQPGNAFQPETLRQTGTAPHREESSRAQVLPMMPRPYPEIRIAFDGDAVLFTDESEMIFKEKGLSAFEENERSRAREPLAEGPFASFLKKLSRLQMELGADDCPIRTALVTSRCAPAHERVLRTMRAWNVRMDEAFFLGGLEKRDVLKAFGAQIFFDDQSVHTLSAAQSVPAARVPYGRAAGEARSLAENRAKK